MSEILTIPSYNEAICTAAQVSRILARPRPTLTGWVNRYEWLGIAPVQPGATRLFSSREIGLLTTLRMVIAAGNMTEALFNSRELVLPEIAEEFSQLIDQHEQKEWGYTGELRPYLPILTPSLRLICRDFTGGGGQFSASRREQRYDQEPIRDLADYPFPTLEIPLGQALRNAWSRTLFVLNGYDLDD